MGVGSLGAKVGAVCVYHEMIAEAVRALLPHLPKEVKLPPPQAPLIEHAK